MYPYSNMEVAPQAEAVAALKLETAEIKKRCVYPCVRSSSDVEAAVQGGKKVSLLVEKKFVATWLSRQKQGVAESSCQIFLHF